MPALTIPTRIPDPPPLANGDALPRDEFERRYTAMPESTFAELIEGIVYVASPIRHTHHGQPHGLVCGWLVQYACATPGVEMSDNATVRLDLDNEVQPDALLRIDTRRGGQSRIDDDDYVDGAPELVVEVAASSASVDMHAKLRAYRRNGVKEYGVWRVLDRAFDWFVLRGPRYERMAPDAAGELQSTVFPGLWLDVEALLAGDGQRVLVRGREGIASPEHAAFRARLAGA